MAESRVPCTPHFLNQAPPRAQQLCVPDFLSKEPHLGHAIVLALINTADVVALVCRAMMVVVAVVVHAVSAILPDELSNIASFPFALELTQ